MGSETDKNVKWGQSGAEHDTFDGNIDKIHISLYGLSEIVYLKTDPDQRPRFVTAIMFKGNGHVTYSLSCGVDNSDHYDYEFSRDIDILTKC